MHYAVRKPHWPTFCILSKPFHFVDFPHRAIWVLDGLCARSYDITSLLMTNGNLLGIGIYSEKKENNMLKIRQRIQAKHTVQTHSIVRACNEMKSQFIPYLWSRLSCWRFSLHMKIRLDPVSQKSNALLVSEISRGRTWRERWNRTRLWPPRQRC